MKNKKLEDCLKNVYSEYAEKFLEYFQRLNKHRQKNKQMSLTSMFKVQTSLNKRGLQAFYKLGFLHAKRSRPHTDGKELFQPAFAINHPTMLDNGKPGHYLASLPLRNDTARRLIDENAINIQSQLNNILWNKKFLLTLDESTIRDSKARFLVIPGSNMIQN